MAFSNMSRATYAPQSLPPDPYVVGFKGLSTISFTAGHEIGSVQLRDLLQKAGLRENEREITSAIERQKTSHALQRWKEDPLSAGEAVWRKVVFDWTTNYGLLPSRALFWILVVWLLVVPAFWFVIWRTSSSGAAFIVYFRRK
jgi:hypothetical protein